MAQRGESPMKRAYKAKALAAMLVEFAEAREEKEYTADERIYVARTSRMLLDELEHTTNAILEEA